VLPHKPADLVVMARFGFLFALVVAVSANLVQDQPTVQEVDKVAKPLQLDEDAPPSVLQAVKETVLRQLRDASQSGQEINAWIALAVGVALMLDGEAVLKWVVVGGVFVFATLLAQNESAAFWGVGPDSRVQKLTGIEAGLICAYIAFHCVQSVILGFGAWFGFFVASFSKKFLVQHGVEAFDTVPWFAFAWYSIFALGFWLLVATKKHVKVLGVVTAFFSGPLVSSSICFFLTESAMKGSFASARPVMGAWVDFFQLLIGTSDGEDVGLWANVTQGDLNGDASSGWPFDRLFGCLLWAACFVLGAFVQVKLKQARAAKARESAIAACEEPLLPNWVHIE